MTRLVSGRHAFWIVAASCALALLVLPSSAIARGDQCVVPAGLSRVSSGLANEEFFSVATTTRDADVVYLGGVGGIARIDVCGGQRTYLPFHPGENGQVMSNALAESLAVGGRDERIYAGGHYFRMGMSSDAGVTWTPGPGALNEVLASASDGNVAYIKFAGAGEMFSQLLKTADGGLSTQRMNQYFRGRLLVLDQQDDQILYALQDDDFITSHDGGVRFQRLASLPTLPPVRIDQPTATGFAVSLDRQRFWILSPTGDIHRSRDSGVSWALVVSVPQEEMPLRIVASHSDSSVAYVGTRNGEVWSIRDSD